MVVSVHVCAPVSRKTMFRILFPLLAVPLLRTSYGTVDRFVNLTSGQFVVKLCSVCARVDHICTCTRTRTPLANSFFWLWHLPVTYDSGPPSLACSHGPVSATTTDYDYSYACLTRSYNFTMGNCYRRYIKTSHMPPRWHTGGSVLSHVPTTIHHGAFATPTSQTIGSRLPVLPLTMPLISDVTHPP